MIIIMKLVYINRYKMSTLFVTKCIIPIVVILLVVVNGQETEAEAESEYESGSAAEESEELTDDLQGRSLIQKRAKEQMEALRKQLEVVQKQSKRVKKMLVEDE